MIKTLTRKKKERRKVYKGHSKEYDEDLHNNLNQNNLKMKHEGRKKNDIEKEAYMERRFLANLKFYLEKGIQRQNENFHIDEWHLHACLE